MLPSLEVVIVDWKSGSALAGCLGSIVETDRTAFVLGRVVVVDNGGEAVLPGSTELPLTVIRNLENRGFAAACNQGAAGSTADYLLFLNPDTLLMERSLSRPVQFLESPRGAGTAICGVLNSGDGVHPVISAARFPTFGSMLASITGLAELLPGVFSPRSIDLSRCEDDCAVDQVNGAFFLIRREVFDQAGGFDEQFFLYFEEVDLSLRVSRLGFGSRYLSDVSVSHHGGHSSARAPAFALSHFLSSRLRYAFKHFPAWQAGLLLVLSITVEPVARLVQAVAFRGKYPVRQVLGAYGRLLWRLPGVIPRRPASSQ